MIGGKLVWISKASVALEYDMTANTKPNQWLIPISAISTIAWSTQNPISRSSIPQLLQVIIKIDKQTLTQ